MHFSLDRWRSFHPELLVENRWQCEKEMNVPIMERKWGKFSLLLKLMYESGLLGMDYNAHKNCHIVNFGQGIGAVKIARLITYKLASFNVWLALLWLKQHCYISRNQITKANLQNPSHHLLLSRTVFLNLYLAWGALTKLSRYLLAPPMMVK